MAFFDYSEGASVQKDYYLDPNYQLSRYFKVADLTPTNTGLDNRLPIDLKSNAIKLAAVLDDLKDTIGPFIISSAYRSPEVNESVGGSPTSRHMKAEAADISPIKMNAQKYWGGILLQPGLLQKMGRVAWKAHQRNSIHVSLPFMSSNGQYIQGVAQVTAPGGAYFTASEDQKDIAKNIYMGIEEEKTLVPQIKLAGGISPLAIGSIVLGITAVGLLILKRN